MGVASSKDEGEDSALYDTSIPTRPTGQRPFKEAVVESPKGLISTEKQPLSYGGNINRVESVGDIDSVPTVFKWEHGGKNVYITGTFNNWERQIPMHRSGNDFTYVHNLKRGKHAYRFIVDDEWRFAQDQPTIADIEGRINNFIDVADFSPYIGDSNYFEKSKEQKILDEDFKQLIPDLDDYTKEPPTLPPHLRNIILNKLSPTTDLLALPNPQVVSLNHLYCTAIKDGMMVLSATQRYREKYFTVVFYTVMPMSSQIQ